MVDAMARIFAELFSEQSSFSDKWEGSPFAPLRSLSSGAKGRHGQRMFGRWAAESGLYVNHHTRSDADLIVESERIEVKLSMLWAAGLYAFMQIRDQPYSAIALVGLSPQCSHIWVAPKEVVWERAAPQHTGGGGTETRWLQFPASAPPQWLEPFGGSADSALASLKRLTSAS